MKSSEMFVFSLLFVFGFSVFGSFIVYESFAEYFPQSSEILIIDR